ncbi:probable carboxylesterase 18 [Typha angustifolia]|uniref:probable carboxylesterase 18 n=1 Tax=Typha angustifolia TaxID=59011 RepID=UPI003C2D7A84
MTGKPSPVPPQLPWKLRLQISTISFLTNAVTRHDGTVNRFLLRFIDHHCAATPQPSRGVRSVDLTVDPSIDLWVRVFSPPTAPGDRLPVIVFFHGGGFVFFSAASSTYDDFCRRISLHTTAVVVSVNYRLSPEHPYPFPYEDGLAALRFLDSGGLDSVGADLDLSSVFLSGDTAGANIAHHVARRYIGARSSWNRVKLAGIVGLQPLFGGEERTPAEVRLQGAPIASMDSIDWTWKVFLPKGSDRNHPAAHVTAQGAEIEAEWYPPTMVVIGGFDPLQDWQRGYCEMLKEKGKEVRIVEYPNGVHGCYIFPELEEAQKTLEEMKDFIQTHINKEEKG